MLRLFLTASLLYNTYYPVNICKNRINRGSLIEYANCEWYNNRCVEKIEHKFPNLKNYNHITVNELNMNANILYRQLIRCNVSIPINSYMMKNQHHIICYDNVSDRYEIISTPLTHNRTRVFIFSNKNIQLT